MCSGVSHETRPARDVTARAGLGALMHGRARRAGFDGGRVAGLDLTRIRSAGDILCKRTAKSSRVFPLYYL